jgi:hypothetical protein
VGMLLCVTCGSCASRSFLEFVEANHLNIEQPQQADVVGRFFGMLGQAVSVAASLATCRDHCCGTAMQSEQGQPIPAAVAIQHLLLRCKIGMFLEHASGRRNVDLLLNASRAS